VQGTLLRRSKKRAAGFTAIGTPLWAERARSELERSASLPAAAR
jgi:hypothetical protein